MWLWVRVLDVAVAEGMLAFATSQIDCTSWPDLGMGAFFSTTGKQVFHGTYGKGRGGSVTSRTKTTVISLYGLSVRDWPNGGDAMQLFGGTFSGHSTVGGDVKTTVVVFLWEVLRLSTLCQSSSA